ncbi:MAG: hypothetical protein J5I99_03870 [Verrucomicrobia bacterium]|nr:hypothetical protein [Kiritimatiellia bacterium]MCO6400350.1 hypothetical protein [Verrucomicrobiota bacterium]
MSKNKTWTPSRWPWEMDVLTLLFVIAALVIPYYYFSEGTGNDVAWTLKEQQHVLWAIGIVVLFVMHLAVAGATLEMISTPILHLLSPTIFALLAYFRIHTAIQEAQQPSILTGSLLQYLLVAVSVFTLTLVMARIRMARHLLRYRHIQWDIACKSPYDSTYFQLMTQLKPLIYPPHLIRACSEGVLLEGWFYLMPLPFEMFQGIAAVHHMPYSTSGRFFASSTKSLVRIELLDASRPVFVSPENRPEFVSYCVQHLTALRGPSAGRTSAGTRAGGTARGTRSNHPANRTSNGTAHGSFYSNSEGP